MRMWTIWVQAVDGATWLEAAWDDVSSAENPEGYREAVEKADRTAKENGGTMRVIAVEVSDSAILKAFEIPVVEGTLTRTA